jgi:hypothetical protein
MHRQSLRTNGRVILAWGEVTGHHHEVVALATETAPTVEEAQFFELDGRRELIVLAPCVLRHQEHDAMRLYPDGRAEKIDGRTGALTPATYPALLRQGDVLLRPLGPGVWQHIQQREQPEPEVWRAVAD